MHHTALQQTISSLSIIIIGLNSNHASRGDLQSFIHLIASVYN